MLPRFFPAILLPFALLDAPAGLAAQAPQTVMGPNGPLTAITRDSLPNLSPVVTRSELEVKLSASRAQLTAGSTVGITATLTNTSGRDTLFLTQSSVILMQPPELEGPSQGIRAWYAYFPTEAQFGGAGPLPNDSVVLVLSPGTSAQIGWWPARQSSAGGFAGAPEPSFVSQTFDQIVNELRFLFFAPGDYQISVQAKYWTDAALRPRSYRIASQTMVVRVMAPQFVIMLGAALGGLIAYLIFPNRRTEVLRETDTTTGRGTVEQINRVRRVMRRTVAPAVGAMLWSAIVTILLSRLSETQFLIRVTVADFWGAIAIGLVAQYTGSKWLERLVPPPPSTRRDANTGVESPSAAVAEARREEEPARAASSVPGLDTRSAAGHAEDRHASVDPSRDGSVDPARDGARS